ncbi:hypothetical protein ABIB38_004039 [Massilia sp. UYP11]
MSTIHAVTLALAARILPNPAQQSHGAHHG